MQIVKGEEDVMNIAILGGGVVGGGVFEVIGNNARGIEKRAGKKIIVKKVVDIRDFNPNIYGDTLTKNADEVFADETIEIVAETIGGTGAAYAFTKRALLAKKHVVTSNKELVATHGPELLKIAEDNGVHYLFEASVGGGIPIIRPLKQCLAANEILEIEGILNGTTNYILTMMKKEGKDFQAALKDAQEKGYAEQNPTADIEGHDACRKLAILMSIAFNQFVDSANIYTEGITAVSTADMVYADAMDSVIKLVAKGEKAGGKLFARVSPLILNKQHPLAAAEDVFNAIVIKGNAVGETMFYGRGAGKLPTASAVVADIIDIVRNLDRSRFMKGDGVWEIPAGNNVLPIGEAEVKMFIRIAINDKKESMNSIHKIFGDVGIISVNDPVMSENEAAFVTKVYTENEMEAFTEKISAAPGVKNVISKIRVEA